MRISEKYFQDKIVWLMSFSLSLILHLSFFFLWWDDEVPATNSDTLRNSEQIADDSSFSRIRLIKIQSAGQNTRVRPVVPIVRLEIVPEMEFGTIDNAEALSPLEESGDDWAENLISTISPIREGKLGKTLLHKVPPLPRSIVVPQFITGQSLVEIKVEVFVDENGKVVSDSTRIFSPDTNSAVRTQLLQKASEWIFDPARIADKPVSSWFSYTIRM